VQISDSHVGFHQAANPNVIGTFKEAVQRINALPQRPAFVIHTGDHVHLNKASEFDTAKQILDSVKTDRIFNIPGEHDVFVDQGKLYLQYFGRGTKGRGWTSFDVNGMHFVALVNDAGAVGKGLGVLDADQLAFIKKDLAGLSSDTPLVLFSHVPLLAVYPQWGWATQDSAQLLALVTRFRSVTALNGHIHQIITKQAGNVVMHTCRAMAYPDHAPGQVAPTALTVPAAELPKRIGIRLVGVQAGSSMLNLQDRSLG
jgi:3',5'-cyclic AMP phosphodiesterase CpdA